MPHACSSLALMMFTVLLTLLLSGCSPGQDKAMAQPPVPAPTGLQWLISVLTPAPKKTVVSLDTLAQQFLAEGQHALAEQHARQALRILEDAWGAEHLRVAPGLDQLAAIYNTQGKYAAAEPLLQNALTIRETGLGTQHPEVGASLERYAALLRQLQRESEAQPLAARAEAIRALAGQAK